MPNITIKEIDDELLERLTELAKARRVSVEKHIVSVLRDSVARGSRSWLAERADAIASMTPKNVEQTDSTILIREDRDR
jgi:predicted transcriptional regulator